MSRPFDIGAAFQAKADALGATDKMPACSVDLDALVGATVESDYHGNTLVMFLGLAPMKYRVGFYSLIDPRLVNTDPRVHSLEQKAADEVIEDLWEAKRRVA